MHIGFTSFNLKIDMYISFKFFSDIGMDTEFKAVMANVSSNMYTNLTMEEV